MYIIRPLQKTGIKLPKICFLCVRFGIGLGAGRGPIKRVGITQLFLLRGGIARPRRGFWCEARAAMSSF